jgi:ATP-dependent DNA helicase RecG
MERYTDEELMAMLHDLESDYVERKESFAGDVSKKAREAVCAFANDLPNHNKAGVLFIGAKDNGNPSGIAVTDQLLITLANMKTDGNILPLPVLTVEKRILDKAEIAVVTVMPSDSPPVKYDGRIWIRTGSRRSLANEQEERMLSEKRQGKILPYDLHPVYNATIDDLSRAFFEDDYLPAAFAKDVLEQNHRTYEERLASCKMIISVKNTTPTFLGLIAIGKNSSDFLYGSYIQFLRVAGTEFAGPVIDEKVVKGRVTELINVSLEKLDVHNRRAFDITKDPGSVVSVDYPEIALRQILTNAVLHRQYDGGNAPVRAYMYDDHIEIISPGGPYGSVTVENFGAPGNTAYRNPNLAEIMRNLNLIQHFGVGIYWAQKSMVENGNPPIEFNVDNSFVRCVLRKRER